MTVPFFSLLPFMLAAILLAWVRPQIALLTPLVFHASYLFRTQLTITQWTLPTTLLEALLVSVVISSVARIWGDRNMRREYWDAWRALPRRALLCVALFVVAATVSAASAPHPQTAWGQWKAFIVEPIVYTALLLFTLRSLGGQRRVAVAILLGGIVSAGLALAVGTRTADFGRLRGIYDVPNSLALVLAPLAAFAFVLARSPQGSALRRLARWSLALFVPALLLTQSLGGLGAVALTLLVLVVPAMRAQVVQYTIPPSPTFAGSPVRQHGGEGGAGAPRPVPRSPEGEVGSSEGAKWGWLRRVSPGILMSRASKPLGAPRERWSVRLGGATAALLGVAFVLLLGLGLQGATGKLTHALSRNAPLVARLQIWQTALALVRDHPILGTGLGTFEPAYQQKLHELLRSGVWGPHAQAPLEWVVRDPHNIVLSFWLNTGLFGLLSMGGLIVVTFRRDLLSTPDSLRPAAGAALLCLLFFGLVDVPYLKNDLSLLWWVWLSVLVGVRGLSAASTRRIGG